MTLKVLNVKIDYWHRSISKMSTETDKTYTGKCVDCGSLLELYEVDFEKNRRIMQCTRCGLYHFYKKDFFGKWKLVKAGKVSDLWRSLK